jgi:hypothetical protein
MPYFLLAKLLQRLLPFICTSFRPHDNDSMNDSHDHRIATTNPFHTTHDATNVNHLEDVLLLCYPQTF